jgi:hypothetical protein
MPQELDTDTFDRILADILREHSGEQLLSVPGVYEAVSEHFNNAVIDRWEEEKTDGAE